MDINGDVITFFGGCHTGFITLCCCQLATQQLNLYYWPNLIALTLFRSLYSSALWNGLQSSMNCHFLKKTSVVTLFLPTAALYYPHIHLLLCQTTSFKLQYLLSRRETGRLLLGLKAKSINAQMLLLNVTWNVNNCAFYTKTSSTFCTKHTHDYNNAEFHYRACENAFLLEHAI